jgi:3-hexulose-6-phosphate synthase
MDYISLPKALAMAVLVAPEVDIIEIGTPLCKAAGMEAVRAMREICPDKLILADLKTPDVGGLEANLAFDAGADMMTVIGGAALATVEQALAVARKRGKEMLMELTGVRDILARATEWRGSASTVSFIIASGMPNQPAANGRKRTKSRSAS